MADYTEIRVRELTEHGSWPWRFIVEGRTKPTERKRWPWSREATVKVHPAWVQLRHGRRDYRPCDAEDARALADHYERKLEPSA